VQVDTKLTQLQNLIDQKQVQLNRSIRSESSGRAGNPRFAEAARRVGVHLQTRGLLPPARTNYHEKAASFPASTFEIHKTTRAERMEQSERVSSILSKPFQSINVQSDEEKIIRRSSEEHLGRFIDLYA